jgi:hypothetical protein
LREQLQQQQEQQAAMQAAMAQRLSDIAGQLSLSRDKDAIRQQVGCCWQDRAAVNAADVSVFVTLYTASRGGAAPDPCNSDRSALRLSQTLSSAGVAGCCSS